MMIIEFLLHRLLVIDEQTRKISCTRLKDCPKIETDNKNSIMLRGDVEPAEDALELERLKDAVDRRCGISRIADRGPCARK
jgi:hypothetical protein